MQVTNYTSSNHRLESAGLNALEELLFKMLGMGREDSNARFVCKGNSIHFFYKNIFYTRLRF